MPPRSCGHQGLWTACESILRGGGLVQKQEAGLWVVLSPLPGSSTWALRVAQPPPSEHTHRAVGTGGRMIPPRVGRHWPENLLGWGLVTRSQQVGPSLCGQKQGRGCGGAAHPDGPGWSTGLSATPSPSSPSSPSHVAPAPERGAESQEHWTENVACLGDRQVDRCPNPQGALISTSRKEGGRHRPRDAGKP